MHLEHIAWSLPANTAAKDHILQATAYMRLNV